MTSTHEDLREEYARYHGEWDPRLNGLIDRDPGFVEAHLAMMAVPWRSRALEPKVWHLVGVALNVATTHLYLPGVRAHVRAALSSGATAAEVMEVFQLVTVIGMHSSNVGVPILIDELGEVGEALLAAPLAPDQEAAKTRYIDQRGNWGPHWERLVRLSPGFLSAYSDFSMVPWREGPLEPLVKELVYVAVNVSPTHLYVQGLRVHLANALAQGATPAQLLAVFQLATSLAMHSVALGAPVLVDVLTDLTDEELDRP